MECVRCGYVYDPAIAEPDLGVKAQTSFEDLPAEWLCPLCGATKDSFEPAL